MVTVSLSVAWHLTADALARLVPSDVSRSNALRSVTELERARCEREEIDAFLADRALGVAG